MEDKNPIQVSDRLFGALEYLVEHGPSGLAELAAALELNKSTAHRIVSSLQYLDYVRQSPDTGKYEASFKLVELANRMMVNMDISHMVRPYLRKLVQRTGETVHFVKMEGADVVYIDKVESEYNVMQMVSRIGSRLPFYRSAVGKAIAARLPVAEVRRLWDSCVIERTTPYTITNYDDFMDALEDVRKRGYALDNEENETGLRCIAAALEMAEGIPEYAFSISVPIHRMDNDRIRELSAYVLEVKTELEKEMRNVKR